MSLSKKVFASSLVFVTALVSALGANASLAAAISTTTTVNGVVYTLDGGGTAYVSGRTSDVPANLSIASSVTIGGASREVVRVGQYAFGTTPSLVSVVIPDSVYEISDYAFDHCSGLTSVTIPNSVMTIGSGAFEYATSLTSVTLGKSLTSIGSWAFMGDSKLKSVTFAGAAPEIGGYVFADASPTVSYLARFGADAVSGGFTSPTWNGVPTSAVYEALTLTPTPVINGLPAAGEMLSADPGVWDDGVSLSYEWNRNGFAIPGATSDTYVLGAADFGAKISVTVTGVKPGYSGVFLISSDTESIGYGPITTINGVIYSSIGSGQAYVSGYTSDLPANASIESNVTIYGASYAVTGIGRQGLSGTQNLASVTIPASVTTLGAYAFGQDMKLVSVTFDGEAPTSVGEYAIASGGSLNGEPLVVRYRSRFGADAVAGGFTSPIWQGKTTIAIDETMTLTPIPTVSGVTTVGQTLTVSSGSWDSGVTLTYQWRRGGAPKAGATSSTYVLTEMDLGAVFTVTVTGTKVGFLTVQKTSAVTPVVVAAVATFSKTPTPVISGSAKVGKTLSAKAGSWDSGVKLTYKWYRSGVAIKGATKASYKLTKTDVGKKITVSVTATKVGFTTVTKASKATAKVSR